MWKIISWRKNTLSRNYHEAQTDVEIKYPGIPGKLQNMEQRRKKRRVQGHIDSFISDSTLHGLHFCFDKKHLVRRIVWTLILLAAFGYVSEKLYASVEEFFKYPMSTTTTIIYENKMEMPAMSFCNSNDFRYSIFNGTKLQRALNNNSYISELTGQEYRDVVEKSNHRLEDMLIVDLKSSEDPRTPHPANFTTFWSDTGTGRCYTYNSGKIGPILTTSKIGEKGAVSFIFNVEQYEYDNATKKAGIRLILHGQNETPIKTPGLQLAPGFETFVAIKKRKIKNLPHPYRTNCGSKKLKHFENEYSQHLCWLDSLTTHVVDICGCKDSFMPGNYEVCSLLELKMCLWGNWSAFDHNMEYDCPIPCETYQFTAQLSQASFPSNVMADKYAKNYQLTGSEMENRLYIRENFLKVTIFYADLSYEYVEQTPSYDLKILLGDIGGQLGLFLGSSVLTYLEFIDCLFMLLYTRYFEVFLPK